MNQIFLETRMFMLSDVGEIMTLAFFVLIQYGSVTDRQTDIPPLAIPAVCIARYYRAGNKKLSYCWETVRRESMTRIAEVDVEMTT